MIAKFGVKILKRALYFEHSPKTPQFFDAVSQQCVESHVDKLFLPISQHSLGSSIGERNDIVIVDSNYCIDSTIENIVQILFGLDQLKM